MTQVPFPQGVLFPLSSLAGFGLVTGVTLNLAGEAFGMMGRMLIVNPDGTEATAPKTLSAAGGGSIAFRSGTAVLEAATTIQIGLEDVEATIGNPARPDESFDVNSASIAVNTGGVVGTAWNVCSMTGGSGSKVVSQGQLVAARILMNARGTTGSLIVQGQATTVWAGATTESMSPLCVFKIDGGAWTIGNVMPVCVVTFDDGSLGILEPIIPYQLVAAESFNASTAGADERGFLLYVAHKTALRGYVAGFSIASGTASDVTFATYAMSDPTDTTPTLVTGTDLALPAETLGVINSSRVGYYPLPAGVTLLPGLYAVTITVNGASNINLNAAVLGSADYRKFLQCGASYEKITRADGAGAFTRESPAITIYQFTVRLNSFDDGTGEGSGGGGGAMLSRIQGGF